METPLIDRKKFNRIRRPLPPQNLAKGLMIVLVLSAIFWVVVTGASWGQLSDLYGNWTIITQDLSAGVRKAFLKKYFGFLQNV